VYAADPMVVVHERFIHVEGKVQNQDGVVHVKADKITPLVVSSAGPESHDFH
jgi:error-prone DNA polymerase